MQVRFILVMAVLLFAFSAAARAEEENIFSLRSPAFADNASIPGLYTCDGKDVSPPLSWDHVPEGTESFALIVDDPDAPDPAAPKMTWVHWVLFNIPANVSNLTEGIAALPPDAGQGLNDWKAPGYRGPCPPVGRHRYFFKLYALKSDSPFKRPPTKEKLERAMQNRILGEAILAGTYEHGKR